MDKDKDEDDLDEVEEEEEEDDDAAVESRTKMAAPALVQEEIRMASRQLHVPPYRQWSPSRCRRKRSLGRSSS